MPATCLRSKKRRLAAAVLIVAVTGCSAARPSRPERAPETCASAASGAQCRERVATLERALGETLAPSGPLARPSAQSMAEAPREYTEQAASAGPSSGEEEARPAAARHCDAARDLRDRICELADAICALAARNTQTHELDPHCKAAESSCQNAKTEVAAACGE